MENIISKNAFSKEKIINLNYEKLLVLEGSCQIMIEDTLHYLFQGDHIYIPSHTHFKAKATSEITCKVLMEGNTYTGFKRMLVFS